MGFKIIPIDDYINLHLKNNPTENKAELRRRLENALNDFKNGVKCACGNDIWVVGSASVGSSCFSCITGESTKVDYYEIDIAFNKRENKKDRKFIDNITPNNISGFFDDDGYEINSDLIKKPSLCLTCLHDNDPNEELLCNMTRFDQKDENDFMCFSYKKVDF